MLFSRFIKPAAIAGMVSFGVLQGIQAQPSPAFEVASIRRNLSGEPNTHINISGGRFTFENGSLKTLIRNAYEILGFQLAGEERWLDTEMYNVVATTGNNEDIRPDQLKLLLQNLLADRFRLRVHWETREASVYALLLAQGGPKFKENSGSQEPGINTQKRLSKGRMQGTKSLFRFLPAI